MMRKKCFINTAHASAMNAKPLRTSTFIFLARFILSALLLATGFCKNAQAFLGGMGVRIGYGSGEPDHLQGQRFALQKAFWLTLPLPYLILQPYWDLSFADWHVKPVHVNQPRLTHIFVLSPVLKIQFTGGRLLLPFIELGIGPSFLERPALRHRHFGGRFAFQDQIGIGFSLDKNQHCLIGYHYIHHSNTGFYPPNQGIDIKHFFSLTLQ